MLYFLFVMIAPAAMLAVGLKWRLSPPPFRSSGLAYSTNLTRQDPDAWTAAHRHCGRLWTRIGAVSGFASLLLIWLFRESVSSFWLWLIVGQMVLFCVSVFMVEMVLKAGYGGESDET